MPKREDEYWAAKKEPKGRGLCPFCGSSSVSYNKKFQSWRCNKCEKSFPSPSYGPGRDLEEEARLRRITAIPRSKFVRGTGKKRTIRWEKSGGGGFSVKKTFLVLLVIALIGATIGAFAGVEPFSSVKTDVTNWFQDLGGETSEPQLTTTTPSTTTTTTPPPPTTTTTIPPTTSPPSTAEYPPIPPQEQLIEYALELINKDRIANGLNTVILGSNSAVQNHAEEMLVEGYLSHWGIDGMKPYMRYTLAGGFNYEAENAFIYRTIWLGGKDSSYQIDPIEVLEEAEESLMNSSGHRRNILNQWHKKVNIGIAYDNEMLTLVQQFEGDYITFNKLPVFSGSSLSLSGETITGFTFDQIQIWYDPLPHSLTLGQLGRTSAYCLGTPVAFIRPPPPLGSYYPTSEAFYSWTKCVDPYTIPPDTPPSTYNPFGIELVPPPLAAIVTVRWIDANHWDISGTAFNIDVNLNEIISRYGKGVYTAVIWAKTGNESVSISNYSVFVE